MKERQELQLRLLRMRELELLLKKLEKDISFLHRVSYYFYNILYFFDKKQNNTTQIIFPPGMYISVIVKFLFSKKIKERVFDSILADMQEEYFEALDQKFKWKMRWIHIRGIFNVLIAVISQLSVSTVKMFIAIWKIS